MNESENITYRRLAIFLIILGCLFAMDSWLGFAFVYKLWPLLIMSLGIGLVGIFIKRRASGMVYLATGEYFICFSVLALYCNFTSWSNIAHLWPYFIYFLAIVFVTLFFFQQKKKVWLLFCFISVSLAILFFLIFSIGLHIWWIIFILIGFSILITGKIK